MNGLSRFIDEEASESSFKPIESDSEGSGDGKDRSFCYNPWSPRPIEEYTEASGGKVKSNQKSSKSSDSSSESNDKDSYESSFVDKGDSKNSNISKDVHKHRKLLSCSINKLKRVQSKSTMKHTVHTIDKNQTKNLKENIENGAALIVIE